MKKITHMVKDKNAKFLKKKNFKVLKTLASAPDGHMVRRGIIIPDTDKTRFNHIVTATNPLEIWTGTEEGIRTIGNRTYEFDDWMQANIFIVLEKNYRDLRGK